MKDLSDNLKFDLDILEKNSCKYLIGLDEAGRGPLAGPLFVGLFLFDKSKDFKSILSINDSKKLTEKKRIELFEKLKKSNFFYDYNNISNEEVDKYNPYQATKKGMMDLIVKLDNKILENSFILTDAVDLDFPNYKYLKLIKGDQKSFSIGAASIVAKVLRDKKMKDLSKKYPEYHFDSNKGYGTKKHLEAIKKNGPTPVHRFSYSPLKKYKEKSQKKFKF